MHEVEVVGVREEAVADRLRRDGFATICGFLADGELARARAIFTEAMARLDRPIGEAWFPTILLPEDDVRAFISDELGDLVGPRMDEVLDTDRSDLMRLDYSVKPPSEESELGPHQDFSLVDETRATSLYVWIPLVDTDASNGTLHVVPGSHRFGNRIRSQHVPAYFDDVLPLVRRSAVRLDCRAGDLVVMVSGVVHFSPANTSPDVRVAIHGIAKPKEVPLVFFFADEDTPEGSVECFEVDMETYIRQIVGGRPGPDVPRTRLAPRPPASMTAERFLRGLEQVAEAT